jgi:hypothetical protein
MRLRRRVDSLEDQVRLYPTTSQTFAERDILGARTVEEQSCGASHTGLSLEYVAAQQIHG